MTEYRQTRFRRPPGSTELLLVRHGESEPMVPGMPFPRVDGHGDPALAPEGERQAELLADRLAGHAIDAIYVTTLRRTVQTAAPLAARLGIEPRVEPDLREVHLGEWEGEVYRQRVAEGHPLAMQMLIEQRWDVIPGAESAESLRERAAWRSSGSSPPIPTSASPCSATAASSPRSSPRWPTPTGRSPSSGATTRRSRRSSPSAGDGSCAGSTTPPTSTPWPRRPRPRAAPARVVGAEPLTAFPGYAGRCWPLAR